MNKTEKVQVVEGLKKTFSESGSLILLGFQGINVPDITELRSRIRDSSGSYEVVKNTLALRAAEGTPIEQVKAHFVGPTAMAYTRSDPVSLAKILKEFVKSHQGMVFKAGVLDGRVLDERQVESLADLPSREGLLSQLLFLLNAPLTRLARALQSPIRDLAVVLNQVAEKKQ